MRSDRRLPVAIVGGGFSGTILAVQLAQRGIHSVLIDGSGRAGRGVAYSTADEAHLLNVRAEDMSALAGEPEHFARRFAATGGEPKGFAQRRFFGQYLQELLAEAVTSGCVTLEALAALAADPAEQGWRVSLAGGRAIEASALVLANGNQEPEPLRPFAGVGRRYLNNPWGDEARAAARDLASTGGTALVIGTGLTMIDLALSLDGAGHGGRAVALSRRGQLPRAHLCCDQATVGFANLPTRLRPLTRWLRRQAAEVGWRAAVDSLRPHTHAIWQRFDAHEQRRFLRHARAWWDVHRHRIAPEVSETVACMIAEHRLELVAARIVAAKGEDDAVLVTYRRRGSDAELSQQFDYVFNCTGPLGAIAHTRDPLLRGLLEGQLIRPDDLGIGLEVDGRSRVPGASRLWALGPLTKGRFWEIVAVPDIREQAAAVADDIAKELGNDRHT